MHIICASICYRGYAGDEVTATLDLAPAIGYKLMEIHGPLVWSVPLVLAMVLELFGYPRLWIGARAPANRAA